VGGVSPRLVSAEEARKLLDRPGLVLAGIGPDALPVGTPTVDDLAATVVRLHDILAAERGGRAPEGWEPTFIVEYEGDDELREEPYTTRWRRIADGHCYVGHSENTHPKCWWSAQDRRNGNKIIGSSEADSLLEAIEAADRAAKNPA